MRVILFSTLFPNAEHPQHGIFVWERLRHLIARHGIDAVVVAPVPYFPKLGGFGRWSSLGRVPRREVRDGVPVYHPRYLVTPKLGMSLYPVTLALGAARVVSRLVREGYELVDAHYLYPDGVAAALLAGWLRVPLVVTGRGSDVMVLPCLRIVRRWIAWSLRRAHGRAAVCTTLAEAMREMAGGTLDTVTLRNGVDTDVFVHTDRDSARRRLGIPPHGRIIASVGLLIERKGHHLAIDALARLRQEGFPDVTLLIVGNGPWEAKLRKQARQRQVADAVIVYGGLPPADMPGVFAAADVLLLASRSEGWANVILESLACGTPVVASAVPGTVEAIRSPDVGIVFAPRSAAGVASALRAALERVWDPMTIRDYARGFSWDETSDGQLALFGTAIRRFRCEPHGVDE